VSVKELAVRDGSFSWRDETIIPAVSLRFSTIQAAVKGAEWPLAGPLDVHAGLEPPGGGQLVAEGRVDVESHAADLRISAKGADISPYVAYLSTPAHVFGRADAEMAVRIPAAPADSMTARGSVALSGIDVRDEDRTMLRLDRASATGVHVTWPQRVAIEHLRIERPWVLIERDEHSALTLRALLPAKSAEPRESTVEDPANNGIAAPRPSLAVEVGRLEIADGGMRIVDRSLSPPFAVDVSRIASESNALSTGSANRARVSVKGQIGTDSAFDLAGTVGALRGPTHVDMSGTLRRLWVPLTDSYLLRYIGWQAREGSLTTDLRVRIDGDALDAKSNIRLSQLDLVRGSRDEAQSHIGLPLGVIVSLMKDSRGDINVSLPIGGHLSDPHFDFREAIWSTVRNVAVKAVTLPISWIGRVRLAPDARIERIEIDPIPFEEGTANPSPEGQAQIERLVQFLGRVPASRVVLTPVVSASDVAAVRRRAVDKKSEKLARDSKAPLDVAILQLYQKRFPDGSPPDTVDAARDALAKSEPVATTVADEIAKARVEAVRALVKKAGIDTARVPDVQPLEGSDATRSLVALDLATPDSTSKTKPLSPDILRPSAASPPSGPRNTISESPRNSASSP